MNDIETLKREIEALKLEVKKLTNVTTIPFDVDQAFFSRFNTRFSKVKDSNKDKDSETETVLVPDLPNPPIEYKVLGDPEGFLEVVIDGITKYIPFYK